MSSGDSKCPGVYCGRLLVDGNFTDCQACPSGFRVDTSGICSRCTSQPSFYDWMYLAFMAIVSLGLHWFFIDHTTRQKRRPSVVLLHLSALIESSVAAVCSLLTVEPRGLLSITSCPPQQLADWYTLFLNPSPDYVHVIHCTQEAVYPLYTLVFVYYAFSLAAMMLVRPVLSAKLVQDMGTKSIYAALYFFPMLIFTHAVLAGFIYYAFPYVIIVVSVITNAVHFSYFRQQTVRHLLRAHVTVCRNIVILVAHWLLHAFGIVALTQLRDLTVHGPLLALVLFPAMFYVFTVRFTDPNYLDVILSC